MENENVSKIGYITLKKLDYSFIHKNKKFKLDPQDDMTPKESVVIVNMMLHGFSCALIVDWGTIIKDNKMERHFIIEKKEDD